MSIILFLAAATAPQASRPVNILPSHIRFEAVARKLENMRVTGCFMDQGERPMMLQQKGVRYSVDRESFERVHRQTGRDLETTMLVLDVSKALCRWKLVRK